MSVPTDPVFWLVAGLAILLVGLAKGGFAGLGAASMPLIALVMDPVQGAAMLLPILMVQDVVSVWSFRKEYDRTVLWQMLPGAAVGIFLGWLFANSVSSEAVKGLVGLIAFAFGAYRMMEKRLGTAGWADWLGPERSKADRAGADGWGCWTTVARAAAAIALTIAILISLAPVIGITSPG